MAKTTVRGAQADADFLAQAAGINSGTLWPAPTKTPIHVNPVDGGADAAFDDQTNHCTRSLDTDNYKTFLTNKQSVRITGDGVNANGSIKETFAAAKDFSNAYAFAIRYKVIEGSGDTSYDYISQLHLYMYDAAGSCYWMVYFNGYEGTKPGYHEVVVTRENVTGGAIANWGAVTGESARLYMTDGSKTPSITIDSIVALPKLTTPRGFLTFDDGHDEHHEIWQRMNNYGLCGTFFVITDEVGEANYLTWDECREMSAGGSLIANHTTGLDHWNTLSLAEKKATVRAAQGKLASEGLPRGGRILATPGGHYEEAVDDDGIMGSYVDVIRTTRQGGTNDPTALWYPWQRNRGRLHTSSTSDLISDAVRDTIKAMIDDAIADGACFVLCLHDIADAAQWTRLDNILAYCKTKQDAGSIVFSTLMDVPKVA